MADAPTVPKPIDETPYRPRMNEELIKAVRAQHEALVACRQFPEHVPSFWREIYQHSPEVQKRVEDVFVMAVGRRLVRQRLESRFAGWPEGSGFDAKAIMKRVRALSAQRTHPLPGVAIFDGTGVVDAAYLVRKEFALLSARTAGRQRDWRNAAWGRCWPTSEKVIDVELHWLARFLATRETHGVFKRKGDLFVLDGSAVDTAPAFGSEHFVSWVTDHGPALAMRARTGLNHRRPSTWVLPADPLDAEELMQVAAALKSWPTSANERLHYAMWANIGQLAEIFRVDRDLCRTASAAVSAPGSGRDNAIAVLEFERPRYIKELSYPDVMERTYQDFLDLQSTFEGTRAFSEGLAIPLLGSKDAMMNAGLYSSTHKQAQCLGLAKLALTQLHNVEAAHQHIVSYVTPL